MTEEPAFEVVIRTDDGLAEPHARAMRREMIRDGFREHAVEVREVGE